MKKKTQSILAKKNIICRHAVSFTYNASNPRFHQINSLHMSQNVKKNVRKLYENKGKKTFRGSLKTFSKHRLNAIVGKIVFSNFTLDPPFKQLLPN